jgi:hypothetical protein
MLHCNMRCALHKTVIGGEKLVERQAVNGDHTKRSVAAALSPCQPAPK